jgi:hypothetical protein
LAQKNYQRLSANSAGKNKSLFSFSLNHAPADYADLRRKNYQRLSGTSAGKNFL